MKHINSLLVIIIVIFLMSCDKDKDETGKVTFYTNAQAVVNCGPFDVEVYINNSLTGIIKEPFFPLNSTPECNSHNSDTMLVTEILEGSYEFTARITCSETSNYIGNFKVKKDSCSLVFIDLLNTYSE